MLLLLLSLCHFVVVLFLFSFLLSLFFLLLRVACVASFGFQLRSR